MTHLNVDVLTAALAALAPEPVIIALCEQPASTTAEKQTRPSETISAPGVGAVQASFFRACLLRRAELHDDRVQGSHFELDVILRGVRWYVAYPISGRQLEGRMEERGVEVDPSTLNRWWSNTRPN